MTRPGSSPLDLGSIDRQLSLSAAEPVPEQAWLARSREAPEEFYLGLQSWQAVSSPVKPRSLPFDRYDFYHDLVLRHLGAEAPALLTLQAGASPRETSYRELAVAASRRATAWQRAGVAAGQTVVMVRPLGVGLLTSLLAALKLGCVAALLPPLGRGFLARRLATLSADHLDVDEIYAPLMTGMPGPAPLGPDAAASEADLERSSSYPSGAPALLALDPASRTPAIPRGVPADAAYLGPLRDGLLALGLRPGQAVAAPGAHILETQPALLMAVLLAGGTFVQVGLDDLRRHPELLATRPLRALGVVPGLRDLLLERPVSLAERCALWFRDPAGATDLERWQAFVQAAGLEGAWAMNLKWDAPAGGCSLFSPRRRGLAHCQVLPSAGVAFFAADLLEDDQPALGPSGRLAFTPEGSSEPLTRPSVIAQHQHAWLYAGSMAEGPQGRTYPVDEVLESLEGTAGVQGLSISISRDAGAADARVTLLVFTGAQAAVEEGQLISRLRRRLETEMGAEFQPDRIHCFPLLPRRDEKGLIDHSWCHNQFVSASLARKARDELHRTLTLLRQQLGPSRKEP